MSERLHNLRSIMAAKSLDALLVANPQNRRYLSGFTGTAGYLVVTEDKAWFVADARYVDQAKAQCTECEVVREESSLLSTIRPLLTHAGTRTLGFEGDFLTYDAVLAHRALETEVKGLQLVATSGLVEGLRATKDDGELTNIARAADIADAAFNYILGVLRAGLRESEVALELETFMRKQGASDRAFDTIVASGWRSALPHGVATDKVIGKGELITMDYGAVVDGYCSDITRTVVLGPASDEQRRVYQAVMDAQLRGIETVRAGVTGAVVDSAARQWLTDQSLGQWFGHGLGHGVGLEIHERPRLSKVSTDTLTVGMVVTVEPGVYRPGWGGVRIEDDVVVERTGARLLTRAPKGELISV